MTDKSLISSYLSHDDECFHVHTFDRDSSAMAGPRRYAETLVWSIDPETHKNTKLLAQFGTLEGLVYKHFNVCRALLDKGSIGLDGME